jgi:hypothetical protein
VQQHVRNIQKFFASFFQKRSPFLPWFMSFAAVLVTAQAPAQEPANAERHLGVNSCAGSTCHGKASTTKKTGVVQNEYLIWQKNDKHARAFTALQSPLGRRIAANLGISAEDSQCLSCHADNVQPDRQGVQFLLSDGVGCEVCHGGSEKWLGPHASGKIPHRELVSTYGLYPTDEPVARARLCLTCHLGDETHVITHRIMGAGHPRLPFELQTFTVIEPAHYVIDDVYRRRKAVAQGVQFWAVGQALALQQLVTGLTNRPSREGAFPELVFFDCQACHHSTTSLRWERRTSMGLDPGMPHFNDANGIMLRAIAARLSPADGRALESDILALHRALSEGAGRPAPIAQRIAATSGRLAEVFGTHEFSAGDMRVMLAALSQSARNGDASDYAAAEQATMAFASIIYTLNTEGSLDASQYASLRAALNRCYDATQKPDSYDPRAFAAAAQSVAAVLPAS